ncbi:MAG: hypothetical protein GX982_07650 [Tissierellia bacterium]|nr:hypothetical protein [Tissierellia bacterium]
MIKIINDPIKYVLKAIKELYPGYRAEVIYLTDYDGEEGPAYTVFDDDRDCPLVVIDASTPFHCVPGLLIHEIAHVVVGIEGGHGKKWEKVNIALMEKLQELFKKDHGCQP